MVLKLVTDNGTLQFIEADEITSIKVIMSGIFSSFDSSFVNNEIEYFDEKARFFENKILEYSGLDINDIAYRINCEPEKLDLVCCIGLYTKGKFSRTLITNYSTYLLSSEGKTIERLI